MRLKDRLRREWRFLRKLRRTLGRVKSIAPDSPNLICDDLQEAMDKWRDRPAMTFEGRTVTYAELDGIANRYAHWAKGLNLRRGQTVDIPMYDFTTHSRRAETERVKPGRVILVEGILLLSDVRLRKMLDASAATLSSSRACERVNVRTDAAGLRF